MVTRKFYLKLLMSLLLVVLAVPQVMADELTVANGTSTQVLGPLFDYNSSGFAHGTGYVEILYPKSLLNGMENVKITSITYYSNQFSFTGGTINVQICETESSNLNSEVSETPTTIATFSNVQNYYNSGTGKWTLDFGSNSFEYSGNKNLLVRFYVTSKGSKDGTSRFYIASTSTLLGSYTNVIYTSYSHTNSSSQGYKDQLPKTTFTYESTGPKPTLSADPTSLSFNAEVGTPVPNNVTISGINLTGNISAEIVDDASDAYSIDVNSITATGGNAQGTITVTYDPQAAGDHTAILRLTSDGATTVDVPLTGTATAPVVPTIAVNPADVTINTEPGNTGTATFTVSGTNLTDNITLTASDGFSVNPTTISAAEAANGKSVLVTYSAQAAGTFYGTITLTSGNVTKTVNVTANVAEAGTEIFTVDKESLDFGNVMLGQNKTLSVKITNHTNDNINPVFTFNNNVFSVEDDSYPVYGGLSQTYNIVYTPQAAGTDYGTLTISVGRNTVTIDLTGNCVEQAAYDITSSAASGVHNFGDVFKDNFATWNVTLTNNGANAVTPVIEGLAAPFSAENVPATLAAGESATITFKFAPTAIQAYGPTSIVVKFAETTAFQFDYTFRGNGIENTGTLPPSFYEYTFNWTDGDGNTHENKLNDIATDPEHMIALMREVYTNKNIPGNLYRGYKADGTTKDREVAYPPIGKVAQNYTSGSYGYQFSDAYGWGMTHDETNFPIVHDTQSSSTYEYWYLNPNEFRPETEGVTLLLVEVNDDAQYNSITSDPSDYASLKNLFSTMFKSVRVIPNSKRVTKNGADGTLFKIDCDKMNRFFFLAKGRLREYSADVYDNISSSTYFRHKLSESESHFSTMQSESKPFYQMFEQLSPVSLANVTVAKDIYKELIEMKSYGVEHDCQTIPFTHSSDVAGHEFNMYGLPSISDDCQDVRDLMLFVPDKRMMWWYDSFSTGENRDGVSSERLSADMFVNYHKDYTPTMGMYVIRQNKITGERNGEAESYTLHLSWESNLTDFVPGENGEYTIYLVNPDGTYTPVATGIPSSQTTFDLTVNMAQHGQQVTYVIQGQDNTGFLSLQFSNEESFIIPGLDPNEKFQMMAGAEYYSRFDPQTVHNFYANGMQVMAYPDAATSDYAGQTFNFYRKAAGDADWTLVGTAQVNTAGTEATVSMVESTQRQQSEYKFGYKQNPATVAVTTDAKGNKVFGVIFDNFKANVSTNQHPSSYSYKMEVANTSLHSNEISIKVYKTQMRNLTGTFTEEYVENDEVRQDVDNSRQFDIDVEHSSKTDILRYGAYRWNSSYGTSSNPFAILNLNSTEEEDISPQGQASNQGEFYSVYMNGDSYIGDDVYVAQGETGQATFVDDVPATTNAAEEYTYAPVIETFTGRADYNTYGAPMQTTATGKIVVSVENAGKSKYTWEANGNTYRYYNVFVDVNTLDLPEGYEVAKIRAWRKIDASYLNEKLDAYAYRAELDANGEFMFDDPTNVPDNNKLGSEPLKGSSAQNEMYRGTFGALDVENGATVPMKFFVRVYFTKDGDDTPAVTYDPIYVIADMGNGWNYSTSITQLTSADGSNYSGTITTGNNDAYIIFTTTTELGNNNTYWFGAIDNDFNAPFSNYVSKYWGERVKPFKLMANKTYNITVSDFHKKSDNYNGDNTAGTVAITEARAKAPMLRGTNDGKYYITEVEVDGELNSDIPTSIFGVQSYKVVTGIKYYNMAGVESDVPFQGVNIEVTTYTDGSRTTRKIMK